jgi:hypothetical protein
MAFSSIATQLRMIILTYHTNPIHSPPQQMKPPPALCDPSILATRACSSPFGIPLRRVNNPCARSPSKGTTLPFLVLQVVRGACVDAWLMRLGRMCYVGSLGERSFPREDEPRLDESGFGRLCSRAWKELGICWDGGMWWWNA